MRSFYLLHPDILLAPLSSRNEQHARARLVERLEELLFEKQAQHSRAVTNLETSTRAPKEKQQQQQIIEVYDIEMGILLRAVAVARAYVKEE